MSLSSILWSSIGVVFVVLIVKEKRDKARHKKQVQLQNKISSSKL